VVMGYVRESARSPWTVFNTIPVPGGQAYPTPIPISNIFIVWAVVLALALAIFWFTSRVTAHHPEQAEEV
jgi:cytochrome bd-type quinol oxidase subunit 1